jgi:hypothetical protein
VTSEEIGLSPIEEKSETSSMFSKGSDDTARRVLRPKATEEVCIARHKVTGYDNSSLMASMPVESKDSDDGLKTSIDDVSPHNATMYYNLVAPSSGTSSLMSTPTEDTFTDAADRSPLDSPYLSAGDKTPEDEGQKPKADIMSMSIDSGLEAAKRAFNAQDISFAKQVQSLREGANLSSDPCLDASDSDTVKQSCSLDGDAMSLDQQRPARLRPKRRTRYASEDSFLKSPASDSETPSLSRPPSRCISLEEIISQPTPVPDKLNFTQLEKFEGLLISLLSHVSCSTSNPPYYQVTCLSTGCVLPSMNITSCTIFWLGLICGHWPCSSAHTCWPLVSSRLLRSRRPIYLWSVEEILSHTCNIVYFIVNFHSLTECIIGHILSPSCSSLAFFPGASLSNSGLQ